MFYLLILVLSSLLFLSELYPYRNEANFHIGWGAQNPSHRISTQVNPFILQGAHESYEQSCHQAFTEERNRQIIAHNPLLDHQFQTKKNQINAEIASVQQALDSCLAFSRDHALELESILDFFSCAASEAELQKLIYNTQKKLTKYLVDSNGIVSIPSLHNLEKIEKIRKRFYKKLKQYREKSDAIIAEHLIAAASSGSGDHFLSHKGSSFASKLCENKINADFYTVLRLVRNNEFDRAAQIIHHYQQKARSQPSNSRQQAENISDKLYSLYQSHFYQIYNEYGVEKQFIDDAQYHSPHLKKVFPPTPNNEYNGYLSERAQEKISIEETVFDICSTEQCAPIAAPADTIEHRLKALEAFKRNGDVRSLSTISLSDDAKRFLEEYGITTSSLEMMQANALQKRAQHEFALITEKTAQQDACYKEYTKHVSIVNAQLIDIGVAYAQENNIAQAFIISDCCTQILTDLDRWSESLPYTLRRTLVYCAAIVQGVGDGVINSVVYAYDHPIEAVLTAALPEIMVPYHVAKITCSALTVTYGRLSRVNYKALTKDSIKEKFDQLYELACTMDGPELVRHATALGTQILIDGKVAHACNAASKKAIRLLAEELNHLKNTRSLSPLFALAGDTRSIKILLHAKDDPSVTQKLTQGSNAFNNETRQFECPASCNAHYEKFKTDLRVKEFTSIIDVTEHGIQRLIERGFTPEEVKIVVKSPTLTKVQADGANVYIKQIMNSYNVIVLNEHTKEVITALKKIDNRALSNLGKNYGWK